ncbi:Similar to S.cerevisiae protein NUT2 (Subunit of the RNA polymerase II mediator complex) [Malassezia sympodialis ATCC 42132]|uniref:Mediator of RNA polymerase II transcription subunit 10 n=1 Tax=Malassezia sympodialis (strain ATCC 42132) TaxID=1230383 RepID=A0A1M8A1E5_MALS4|nr:Similar to S.cerevisiae protein NUT2 (Subunit of the RNA polymerase II mediator complex) [Malassezia sympodialis ATCC 42132]
MAPSAAPVTPTSASPSPPGAAGGMERHGPVGSEPIRVEEIVRRDLETRTLAVVDALYDLAARAADGQPSSVLGVGESVNHVVRRLADIDAMRGHIHARIPKDVLDLVDAGRNPDSHTRSLMNRLASENQYSLGQHEAIQAFRDKLGQALAEQFPALQPSLTGPEARHSPP